MWTKIISWAFKSVLGRYVTVGLVTVLLGGAAVYWHNFKEDLRDEGAEECIQIINQETHSQMVAALADSQAANAQLRAEAAVTALVNAEAEERLKRSESIVESLKSARLEQEKTDETYAEWSAAPLPDGVADRLRSLRPAGDTSPGDEDGR